MSIQKRFAFKAYMLRMLPCLVASGRKGQIKRSAYHSPFNAISLRFLLLLTIIAFFLNHITTNISMLATLHYRLTWKVFHK